MTTELASKQAALDDLHRSLEAQTRRKVCRVSGKPPMIIWWHDTYVATCADHRPAPCMWRTYKPAEERLWSMTQNALANRPQQTALTTAEVQKLICPFATPVEAEVFIRFCAGNGLNPLINDAYLIKYDKGAKAAIVIGIQAVLKRAAMNPNYTGYQSGIVVERNGAMVEQEGSLTLKGDVLLGGWCRVTRSDWPQPLKVTVSLHEYDKGQALWREKRATLIEKVAVHQGHRRAFPGEVGRIFDSARALGATIEEGDAEDYGRPSVIDVSAAQVVEASAQDMADLYGPAPDAPSAPANRPAAPVQAAPASQSTAVPSSAMLPEPPVVASVGALFTYGRSIGFSGRMAMFKVIGITNEQSLGTADDLQAAAAKLRETAQAGQAS